MTVFVIQCAEKHIDARKSECYNKNTKTIRITDTE